MEYKNVTSSAEDLFNNLNDRQPSPRSSIQQIEIWENKVFSKYRLHLFVLLVFLLTCLIVLLAIFTHQYQRGRTSNSSVSTPSSVCNNMNGTSIDKNATNGGCEYFTRFDDWDYPYNDMLSIVVDKYETCCSMCWYQASCMAFAYSPTTKDCWIKTTLTDDGGYYHSDRISGFLRECLNETRLDNSDSPGKNIFENDMNGSIPVSTWQTCCGLCVRQTLCKTYTYSSITHQCWLKSEAGMAASI